MPEPMSISAPAPRMPVRSDQSRRPIVAPSPVRTRKEPSIEATMPIEATRIGSMKMLAWNTAPMSDWPDMPPTSTNLGRAPSLTTSDEIRYPAPTMVRATAAMIEPT